LLTIAIQVAAENDLEYKSQVLTFVRLVLTPAQKILLNPQGQPIHEKSLGQKGHLSL